MIIIKIFLGLLYIAPELLRCYNSSIQISFGTQKGDVYSFSIILYELHSRKGPFGENHGLGVSDILRKIIYYTPESGSDPFRLCSFYFIMFTKNLRN